jgi:hypothetical protein
MAEKTTLEKLIEVRNDLAQVFKVEATDEVYDNGTLSLISNAITTVEQIIEKIKKRVIS